MASLSVLSLATENRSYTVEKYGCYWMIWNGDDRSIAISSFYAGAWI